LLYFALIYKFLGSFIFDICGELLRAMTESGV
jgi:hypothetical protein